MTHHERIAIGDKYVGVLSQTAGDGETRIFLHGIGASASFWNYLWSELPAGRCIAWEAPGYGASSPLVEAHPGPADYAEVLWRLVSVLSIRRLHLVGHSWGAVIAANFARSHAEVVQSLALINPSPGYGSMPLEDRAAGLKARLSTLDELGPQKLAQVSAPSLVSPYADPAIVERAFALGVDVNSGGMTQALRMMFAADLDDYVRQVTMPLLVLNGEDDKVTPPIVSEQIALAAPAASYITLKRCGHLAPLEREVETAAALIAFWRSPGKPVKIRNTDDGRR